MDLPALTKLTRETPILTEPERAFWLEHLPTMKPEQCARLEQLIAPQEDGFFEGVLKNFFASFIPNRG